MKLRKAGFTLIEILIVITIIMLLVVFILISMHGQIQKANDAKRKSNLFTLHNVLEEYNNDHNGYPAANALSTCGGAGLSPYLKQIPCDPATKQPYGYFRSTSGGYRICAILEDVTDPAIAAIGCAGSSKCGLAGGYNYCLANGTSPSAVGTSDQNFVGPADTPTPTGGAGGGGALPPTDNSAWACAPPDSNGNSYCNFYSDPTGSGCRATFAERTCGNSCGDPAVRCNQ